MTFVALPRPGGVPALYVNPETVDTVADLVPSAPPLSLVSFIGEGGETRETVDGTAAAVAALLDAGLPAPGPPSITLSAGQYLPALSSAPIAPMINVFFPVDFTWSQVGKVVTVAGNCGVGFSGPGTAPMFIITPPGLAGTPGDKTGGGALTVIDPAPGLADVQGEFTGIGAAGGLAFEISNPTGILTTINVRFCAQYVIP